MKHIFTPWRMAYIAGQHEPGCIFCKMVESDDDRANLILHRGERAFLVLNKYPYNNGHLMAVPYHHVDSIEKLAAADLNDVMAVASLAVRVLRAVSHPEGFNLGANIGHAAGAGVKDHVHLHIVPRWIGDTNFVSLVGEVRVIPQTLEDTYDQLRDALTELLGAETGAVDAGSE